MTARKPVTKVAVGKKKAAPRKPGRPSAYSQKVADKICGLIASGKSLRDICSAATMPAQSTVFKWLGQHEEFSKQYARAREVQAETMADEILSIADDGRNDTYVDEDGKARTDHDVVARSRLRVEARKWLASKLAPKKYGEKVTQEVSGPGGAPVPVQHSGSVALTADEAYLRMLNGGDDGSGS